MKKRVLWSGVLLAAIVACSGDSTVNTGVSQTPRSANLTNGTVTVQANSWVSLPVTITRGMAQAMLTGSFTARGGSGNDIKVLVMDETAYVNWSNGHSVSVYYTSGQMTTGSFSVNLRNVGNYVIVYDNSFSLLSTKYVSTRVDLNWIE